MHEPHLVSEAAGGLQFPWKNSKSFCSQELPFISCLSHPLSYTLSFCIFLFLAHFPSPSLVSLFSAYSLAFFCSLAHHPTPRRALLLCLKIRLVYVFCVCDLHPSQSGPINSSSSNTHLNLISGSIEASQSEGRVQYLCRKGSIFHIFKGIIFILYFEKND